MPPSDRATRCRARKSRAIDDPTTNRGPRYGPRRPAVTGRPRDATATTSRRPHVLQPLLSQQLARAREQEIQRNLQASHEAARRAARTRSDRLGSAIARLDPDTARDEAAPSGAASSIPASTARPAAPLGWASEATGRCDRRHDDASRASRSRRFAAARCSPRSTTRRSSCAPRRSGSVATARTRRSSTRATRATRSTSSNRARSRSSCRHPRARRARSSRPWRAATSSASWRSSTGRRTRRPPWRSSRPRRWSCAAIASRSSSRTSRSSRKALFAGLVTELRRLTGHVEELHFLDLPGRLASRIVRLARESQPDARTNIGSTGRSPRATWPR